MAFQPALHEKRIQPHPPQNEGGSRFTTLEEKRQHAIYQAKRKNEYNSTQQFHAASKQLRQNAASSAAGGGSRLQQMSVSSTLVDQRTNVETGAPEQSPWQSGLHQQSTFVRDLKKELGMVSAEPPKQEGAMGEREDERRSASPMNRGFVSI